VSRLAGLRVSSARASTYRLTRIPSTFPSGVESKRSVGVLQPLAGVRLWFYGAHRAAHLFAIVGSVGRVKPPYTSGRRLVPFGSAFAAKPPLRFPISLSPPSVVEQADNTKPRQAPVIRGKRDRVRRRMENHSARIDARVLGTIQGDLRDGETRDVTSRTDAHGPLCEP
jgi:hypothetical protein